jgi:hypothetical protein
MLKLEKRIKTQNTEINPQVQMPSSFRDEFSGKKVYEIGRVEADCNRGLVVGKLGGVLLEMGITAFNKNPIDLYVADANQEITTLFEVKTDVTSTSCYSAIGQLFFYSAKLANVPRLVAVFPDSLDKESREVLNAIGIGSLTYSWVENKPDFNRDDVKALLSED